MIEFIRKCPKCDKDIKYCNKYTLKLAIKNNGICKSCSCKEKLIKIHEEIANGIRLPLFKNKKHKKESIEKMLNHPNHKSWTKHDNCVGTKSHFKGIKNEDYLINIWTIKYGKDIAYQKLNELRKKQSINSSGQNNGMYGKPSPLGSGNGWSGWYKNWYFRSLLELSFMILVIERFNFKWNNAENIKIKYINFKNINRNYFPDFLLNNKYLIEIKPKNLFNSIDVIFKKEAAIEYCNNNNLIYKLISPNILSFDIIKQKYLIGEIKFIERYDKKFKEKYL